MNLASFLLTTPYIESKDYCINKCMEIDKDKYLSKPVKMKRNIKFYLSYFRNHGLIYSAKKVFKKITKA